MPCDAALAGRPVSTTSTRWRARPSTSAALRPAGPPPTITASRLGLRAPWPSWVSPRRRAAAGAWCRVRAFICAFGPDCAARLIAACTIVRHVARPVRDKRHAAEIRPRRCRSARRPRRRRRARASRRAPRPRARGRTRPRPPGVTTTRIRPSPGYDAALRVRHAARGEDRSRPGPILCSSSPSSITCSPARATNSSSSRACTWRGVSSRGGSSSSTAIDSPA